MQDADDQYRNVLQTVEDKMLACLETSVSIAHHRMRVTDVRVGLDRIQSVIEQVTIRVHLALAPRDQRMEQDVLEVTLSLVCEYQPILRM